VTRSNGTSSRNGTADSSGRVLVLTPQLRGARDDGRTAEARLAEAAGLALAIGLTVVKGEVVRLSRFTPATLIGSGTVATLGELVAAEAIELVFVDGALSPVQQRNLERAWKCKVIDRTGLILEIFGERARTREGQLQVELAALTYQRSRLVRSWTHLERQRGGFGFVGGPGESQLEMDRRLIGDRILRIRHDLEDVKRTRGLHRRAPQARALPGGRPGGLHQRRQVDAVQPTDARNRHGEGRAVRHARSDHAPGPAAVRPRDDLVGHGRLHFRFAGPDLVAAFRATLEEVEEADLLLHVRDVSHPETATQRDDVHAGAA